MGITTGILLFTEVEELDFVGPWEVFTAAANMNGADRVVTIAEHAAPVRCNMIPSGYRVSTALAR